jgi:hypothetical protein
MTIKAKVNAASANRWKFLVTQVYLSVSVSTECTPQKSGIKTDIISVGLINVANPHKRPRSKARPLL